MGGDEEALGAWQDQEDALHAEKNLEIGNAWKVLYRNAQYFTEQDMDPNYQPLYQKVRELHDLLTELERKNPKSMDFFGIKKV